jgi:hypothetical protein
MRARLFVLGSLLAACSDAASRPDANQGIDVILAESEVYVTGTVTDAVSGAPLAGASIATYHSGGGGLSMTPTTVITDAQGNYTLTIETGGYAPFGYIRVVKTGYLDTFHWPGSLTTDVLGMNLVSVSTVQRDQIYATAGISSDPSKLLVRVSVTDGAAAIEGAAITSSPSAPRALPTDATGVGYLLNAPTYLKITATKGAQTESMLYLEAYEQGGQLVTTSLTL